MTIPSEQLGWSNESKLLRDILKKLERLGIIISSGSSQLTSDELAAIQGANSPDAGNPFATIDDLSGACECVIVSQTEPTNPSDGLLWYKPDLCLTTTTTTLAPPDCPEGAIYSGWMNIGSLEGAGGYYSQYSFGSVSNSFPVGECPEVGLYWAEDSIFLYGDFGCEGNVIVTIYGDSYELPKISDCAWILEGVLDNPFSEVGVVLPICILCSETTTTTTQPI